MTLANIADRLDRAAIETVAIGGGDQWPMPKPIQAVEERVAYPVDALPPGMREAVGEVQAYVQAPVAMVAASALSAMSLAGQGLVDVERDARLTGPASLSLLTVAESGERKSTCDGYFMKPVRDWERDEAIRLQPAVEAAERERQIWHSERAGLMEAIKAAAKGKGSGAKAKDDLAALGPEPARARVPSLIHTDLGPEALGHALATEYPCGGIVSSEAGAVFGGHAFGKESMLRNFALLNVLWDGGEHRVRRRTSEDFTVRGARLTVALMTQPAALEQFMEASGDLSRGTGFMARFLLSHPETTQGTRQYREPPSSWPALDRHNARIGRLLSEPLPWDGSGVAPPRLAFDPEAKAFWTQAFNQVEIELRDGGECVDVRDVASKSLDNAARIAGLLHVLEYGAVGAINVASATSGVRLALWHLSEARRVLKTLAPSPAVVDAEKLEAFLVGWQADGNRMGTKEAAQYGPARGKRFDPALALLVKANRARIAKVRKEKLIELNPALELPF